MDRTRFNSGFLRQSMIVFKNIIKKIIIEKLIISKIVFTNDLCANSVLSVEIFFYHFLKFISLLNFFTYVWPLCFFDFFEKI